MSGYATIHYVLRRLIVIAAVVMAIGGCASATLPAATTLVSPYAVFSGMIHLRGEIRVDGAFLDAITGRQESCAQYALGARPATTLWVTPTPGNSSASVGGHLVSFTAGVGGASVSFQGPGTYSTPAAEVDDLEVDNSSFVAGTTPKTAINVAADASGSMTFSGLVDTDTDAAESGSETWTCRSGKRSAASPSAGQSTGTRSVGPLLTGTISITGAYTDGGAFTTHAEVDSGGAPGLPPAGYTCADYSHGAPGPVSGTLSFTAPAFDTGGVNGATFETVLPNGYRGPGTYASAEAFDLAGDVSLTIPPASAPQFDTFTSRYAGSTVLIVNADGSGEVRMTDWASSASDSHISGVVSWVCRSGA